MFKRPRLSTGKSLVNVSPTLALLFLAVACSPTSPPPDSQDSTGGVSAPADPIEADRELPAVWSSGNLGTPITSLGLDGELGNSIAVVFEDGGIQMLNFDGDRISQKTLVDAKIVANGRYTILSDTPVSVFPVISTTGELKAYLHRGEMNAPLAFPLDPGTDETLAGLCTARPEKDEDGIMRLAFWTEETPNVLQYGRIVEVNDNLIFLPDEPTQSPTPISACTVNETDASVYSEPVANAARLERGSTRNTVVLDTSGNFAILAEDGTVETLNIRRGISVKVPSFSTALAGTGDTRRGGNPGGLVIISGEVDPGDHRVILVDPSDLTLSRLGAN